MIFLYLKKFFRYFTCRNVLTPITIIDMTPNTSTLDLILSFWSLKATSLATRVPSSFLSYNIISFTLNA